MTKPSAENGRHGVASRTNPEVDGLDQNPEGSALGVSLSNNPFEAIPIVTEWAGWHIVRDDLLLGGTKARFIHKLFAQADEVVYASPCEGGAQTAIATCAAQLGKRATIFVAKRMNPHPRSLMAKGLGATVVQIDPGYLTVVQSRAKAYAREAGAFLVPFGADLPEAIDAIASAARATGLRPDEVWCAAGSGVLMRGLTKAWPKARRVAVQVGRKLSAADVAGAEIVEYPLAFGKEARHLPPFPADLHYDAKAWECARARPGEGTRVFWNVTGPPKLPPQ